MKEKTEVMPLEKAKMHTYQKPLWIETKKISADRDMLIKLLNEKTKDFQNKKIIWTCPQDHEYQKYQNLCDSQNWIYKPME